jgi:malate dehydrogenase (oxaloacetate-decarboxylating)
MDQKTLREQALAYHQGNGIGNGKIEVVPKVPVGKREQLSLAYTPGVAQPCLEIHDHPETVYDYTAKPNTVFVVSDGSAVLGLGNIGPAAGLPVMEGKSLLFKIFGGVDAYPIILDTQDTEEIIRTVKLIALGAGGINLEDISAPRCFEIEERLSQELDIPVFHDDQHGTAVVCLAGLYNCMKATGRELSEVRMVINGSGAAGVAIAKLLMAAGAKDIVMCDTKGAIWRGRAEGMNPSKEEIASLTNPQNRKGKLADVIYGAEVFIGVSAKGVLTAEMVKTMGDRPLLFAMANPDPEILPEEAYAAGAYLVATGRSDFPNQVNNCLGFPAIFRGLLDVRAKSVTVGMKLAAARAIADCVSEKDLAEKTIIPSVYHEEVFAREAEAVARQAVKDGVARIPVPAGKVYRDTLAVIEENRKRFF